MPSVDLVRSIRSRLDEVRARVAAASARRGGSGDVRIVAVSKGHPPEVLAAAIEAGAEDLGENYVQEMAEKVAALGAAAKRVRWHFVGRLQSNKARALARLDLALVHSIDSVEVARELDRRLDRRIDALVQVNIAGEATKAGVDPARDLWPLLASLRQCEHVRVVGLMTIPPPAGGPRGAEEVRRYYQALRALRDGLRADFAGLEHLSMGTSQDYEVAVEEGATLLRLGTAILGPRPAKRWRAGGAAS